MAEHVVDLLEAIEVDAQHGERCFIRLGGVDPAGEIFQEGGAIGQIRQDVMICQMLDAGFRLLALGDVLGKAEEIALFAGLVRYRRFLVRQDARAVVMGVNHVLVDGLQLPGAQGLAGEREQVVHGFPAGLIIGAFADQIAACDPENRFGGPVDQHVAPVARVLDGDRHRHVLDDAVEKVLGAAEFGSGRIEGLQLTEMHQRNRQAGERQCEEETHSDAGTLPHHAAQERRDRDVDHERADDVAEPPLGLAGLQRVMTVHAALFVRHGRINRAEHSFAIDVEQLRYRFRVWRRRDGLDGQSHLEVRWRRQDFASRAADRGQVKIGTIAVLLVESFDGMGPERRRNRRVMSKLRSDGRIVADKGVHQLECDDLLAALVLLEPVEAEIIEATADRHRKHGAEAQMQHEAATGT